jgi:hypothetical protein
MPITWSDLPDDVVLCVATHLTDEELERLYPVHHALFILKIIRDDATVTLVQHTSRTRWVLAGLR